MKTLLIKSFALFTLLATTLAAKPAEDEWQKVTSKEGSISMSVPPSWLLSDDENPAFQAEYEKLRKNNPEWAKKMSERPAGAVLVVLDLDAVSKGQVGVVHVIKSQHGGLTTKMYGDVAREIAKGLPLKGKLEHKVLDIPAGKALSYWGTLAVKQESGATQELDMLCYLFLKGEDLYIVQFMCEGSGLKAKRETFEKIIKTTKTS